MKIIVERAQAMEIELRTRTAELAELATRERELREDRARLEGELARMRAPGAQSASAAAGATTGGGVTDVVAPVALAAAASAGLRSGSSPAGRSSRGIAAVEPPETRGATGGRDGSG